jgi:hypothetical protein
MTFDFPGPIVLNGNGTFRLYIDDEANTHQRKELEEIFQERKAVLWK